MRSVPAAGIIEAKSGIYDCWNRIGVRGDKSCPELQQHSHCRNCPAYSAAAATLLDRELANVPAAPTALAIQASPIEEGGTESAVIFRIGSEWFALSTLLLQEITSVRVLHSLPHRRNSALLGLTNVRGELVVCLSVARLLTGEAAASPQGRLIVIRHSNGRLAFPVDEVQQAHRYRPDDLKPVPATVSKSVSSLTRGLLSWRKRMVGCLDDRLFLDALSRCLT